MENKKEKWKTWQKTLQRDYPLSYVEDENCFGIIFYPKDVDAPLFVLVEWVGNQQQYLDYGIAIAKKPNNFHPFPHPAQSQKNWVKDNSFFGLAPAEEQHHGWLASCNIPFDDKGYISLVTLIEKVRKALEK
ncbi:hypothetical protein FACS189456_3740 [Bacteroidia bacterium]|nr:hypothetical protein FACS189456_3740 [Bacteroidia bacterium]